MGAIVAALNKSEVNVIPEVVKMLKELTHRGNDSHGVATPNSAVTAKSIEELVIKNIGSRVALGHNLSHILSKDKPQPVQGNGFTLVFEGRLFSSPSMSIGDIVNELDPDPFKKSRHILESFEGSYVFAVACPQRIIAARDPFGTNPLYYGENETTCAVVSERKALWAIGIRNAKSFPPGNVAAIDAQGFAFQQVKTATQPFLENLKMKTAAERLQKLLLNSVKNRVSHLRKVAIAFSGGLDSSVIAALAKKCEIDVQLFSVGLENQPEIRFVKKAADVFKLPLHLQTYTVTDVEEILPKVLWLIEEPNVMKASIAVPFYWVAENASKLGYRVLLSGQGSDELFGGYQRYLGEYEKFGIEVTQKIMNHDISMSYKTNFQRDNQVCSFHKVEVRFPFVDRNIVNFSSSLPLRLKIESAEDKIRKRVLRQVARNLGLPLFIVQKAKKAVQYSTGVDKAIKRLAKKERSTPRNYVKKIFLRIKPALETS